MSVDRGVGFFVFNSIGVFADGNTRGGFAAYYLRVLLIGAKRQMDRYFYIERNIYSREKVVFHTPYSIFQFNDFLKIQFSYFRISAY